MSAKSEANENSLEDRVHHALRNWYDRARPDGLLTDLLIFEAIEAIAENDPRLRTNALVERALLRLSAEQSDDAALLRARFIEKRPADQVAIEFKFAESTIFSKQNQAIKRLTKALEALETDAWRDRQRRVDDRIPVPAASDPVGHDAHLDLSLIHI